MNQRKMKKVVTINIGDNDSSKDIKVNTMIMDDGI